jgi:hypothetical protein
MLRLTPRSVALLLLIPLFAVSLQACLFPGGSGGSDRIQTTTRGVQGRLSGEVEAIATDIEDVFRFLNIQWSGQTSLGDGAEIRGYSGNDEVIIRLRAQPGEFTGVRIQVKEPGARIGTGRDRWNREAARRIFSEIRKWRAG